MCNQCGGSDPPVVTIQITNGGGNALGELTDLVRDLSRQLDHIERQIYEVLRREKRQMIEFERLRGDVANLRNATNDLGARLVAAIERLSDEPDAEDVAAVRDEIGAVVEALTGFGGTIDSIDPDVPGGAVTEGEGDQPPLEPEPGTEPDPEPETPAEGEPAPEGETPADPPTE